MEAMTVMAAKKRESKVARLINAQIELLHGEKTQTQIAAEMGYAKPNIVTMFKKGDTRLPLGNLRRIASALELDPARLARIALQEYEPEVWDSIVGALGEPVSANERTIVQRLRELTEDADYAMTEPDEIVALEAFAATLKKNKDKKVVKHY